MVDDHNVATILVVEDIESVRLFIEVVLASEGYNVRTAIDGESALAAFEDTQVDLVIIDLIMPKMSGLELASELQRLHRNTKIIILSGALDELSAPHAVLHKPFTSMQLLRLVRGALNIDK